VAYVDLDAPVRLPDHTLARPGSGGGTAGQVVPWGIHRVGAAASTGKGIHVYVLDTGIDSRHADLAASLGNGFAAESCKGGGCQFPWDDDHDHGTHVAGTIGALNNGVDVVGVAPEVTLHAVKVLSKAGSGSRSGVIAGIDWVASETRKLGMATVANMSLGGSGSKSGTCTDAGFSGTDTYHAAICNARNAGVVFVVAAGNDGADAAGAVPAAYDDAVITVSATTCSFSTSNNVQSCSAGSDDWTSWSNWGNRTASWTGHASAPVAVAAPGRGILSTKRGGGTVSMSGTSMASPHAAGAAAVFLGSRTQKADGSAFGATRAALLQAAEGTGKWSNTSGKPHAEGFLQVGGL
jgi:subtilisin